MIAVGAQRIFLYSAVADMRCSFDGLSARVQRRFPGELLSGALFVFVNKRRTMVKVLSWHGDGLVLWSKRLERGTFRVSWGGASELSRREFMMLLEGVVPDKMSPRFALK